MLKYGYANSSVEVKWNRTVGEYIPVKKGVLQGAVLSSSIFKWVLALCLQQLQLLIFYNDNLGISHIAYADDVLLLSRTKHSLITNFDQLSATLSIVGLSVNASKCEFLCFGSPLPASPLCLGSSTIPCSAGSKWLGLSFSMSLLSTCSAIMSSVLKSMRVGYRKISPNHGWYNQKGLCCLYSSFCALLFFIFLVLLSSFAKRIQRNYTQNILSIAIICCVCLGGIGIMWLFLNLTSLMHPCD